MPPATRLMSIDLSTGLANLQAPDGQMAPPIPLDRFGGVEGFKELVVNKGIATPQEFDNAIQAQVLQATQTPAAPNVLQASPMAASLPAPPMGVSGHADALAATPAAAPPVAAPGAPGAPPPAAPGQGLPAGWTDDPRAAGLTGGPMAGAGYGIAASTGRRLGDVDAVIAKAERDEKAFNDKADLAQTALDEALALEKGAIQKQIYNEEDRAGLLQGHLEDRNKIVQEHAGTLARLQEQHAQYLEDGVKRQEQSVRELANMSINPERFYHDRGTAATIGMAIAAGMGSFASSINGGPNYALKIIDDAISRDINAQMAAMENKRNTIAMQDTAMNRAMQVFQTKEERIKGLQAAAYKAAEDEIAVLSTHMDALTARTQGDQLISGVKQKHAKAMQELAEARKKSADQVTGVMMQAANTIVQDKWKQNEFQMELLKKNPNAYIPNVIYKVDGRKADLPDHKKAEELRAQNGSLQAAMTTADKLKKLLTVMEQAGDADAADRLFAKAFPDEQYSTAQSYLTQLVFQLKDTHKLGAFDSGVERVSTNFYGSPTDLRGNFVKKLDTAIDSEIDNFDGQLAQYEMKSNYKRSKQRTVVDSGVSAR